MLTAEDLKSLKEICDFFLTLPEKLITMPFNINIAIKEKSERIRIQKEIVEMREIGKQVQTVYFYKGNIISAFEEIRDSHSTEAIALAKKEIETVIVGLEAILYALKNCTLSQKSIVLEGHDKTYKALNVYRKVATIPNDVFLKGENMIEVSRSIEALMKSGSLLIQKLDKHRNYLDHVYG